MSEDAKVSPAEEMEELERRREQLGAEIAQLEAEWVLSFFLYFHQQQMAFFSLDCIFQRLFCLSVFCLSFSYRGYDEKELEHHINMLHEYNDIKDIGQSLLGRIGKMNHHVRCLAQSLLS